MWNLKGGDEERPAEAGRSCYHSFWPGGSQAWPAMWAASSSAQGSRPASSTPTWAPGPCTADSTAPLPGTAARSRLTVVALTPISSATSETWSSRTTRMCQSWRWRFASALCASNDRAGVVKRLWRHLSKWATNGQEPIRQKAAHRRLSMEGPIRNAVYGEPPSGRFIITMTDPYMEFSSPSRL